jgi:fructosamine-3-kinase
MALPFETQTLAALNAAISRAVGGTFRIRAIDAVTGGCVHRAFVVGGRDGRFFVKVNTAATSPAFEAEADGLNALRDAGVRAPEPIATGVSGSQAWLILEHLQLRAPRDADHIGLAVMLADLHETTGANFGWSAPNFIGASPQANPWMDDWTVFFRDARLGRQLELIARSEHGPRLAGAGERLLDAVPALLADHRPVPTLVHGDLWNGNAGFLRNGSPVMFDPAVHYADRECDLAMTELFGGFPRVFYDTYFERAPVDDGYAVRRELYNLYHVLNHANLFGGTYVGQAEAMMERLLAVVA